MDEASDDDIGPSVLFSSPGTASKESILARCREVIEQLNQELDNEK